MYKDQMKKERDLYRSGVQKGTYKRAPSFLRRPCQSNRWNRNGNNETAPKNKWLMAS